MTRCIQRKQDKVKNLAAVTFYLIKNTPGVKKGSGSYINDTISVQTSTQSRVGDDWCQQSEQKLYR